MIAFVVTRRGGDQQQDANRTPARRAHATKQAACRRCRVTADDRAVEDRSIVDASTVR
jgi:hypothetical protein